MTGQWILDVTQSDNMPSYMPALGVSDVAIQAGAKAEEEIPTYNRVTLDERTYTIEKKSRLTASSERFQIGGMSSLGYVTHQPPQLSY